MELFLWRLSVSVVPFLALLGNIYCIDMLHRRRKFHLLTTKRRGRAVVQNSDASSADS